MLNGVKTDMANEQILEDAYMTQDKLKELLHYNPISGLFTWLKSPNRKISIGSVAGTLSTCGYIKIKLCKRQYPAHRLAFIYMNGTVTKNFIDHIDRNPSNNAFENLRECTSSQNLFNTQKRVNNTSGYKGVFWHKKDCRWVASATVKGVKKHLGNFLKIENAALAYKTFAEKHHGDFINTISMIKA